MGNRLVMSVWVLHYNNRDFQGLTLKNVYNTFSNLQRNWAHYLKEPNAAQLSVEVSGVAERGG